MQFSGQVAECPQFLFLRRRIVIIHVENVETMMMSRLVMKRMISRRKERRKRLDRRRQFRGDRFVGSGDSGAEFAANFGGPVVETFPLADQGRRHGTGSQHFVSGRRR